VPTIAWHSLVTSLDKAGTPKTGWAGLLTAAAAGAHLAPTVTQADASATTGTITPAEEAWFAARGPGALVGHIRIPTLLVQGTVDTLFTLQEGVENYQALRAAGVPVHMIWYCGGHGVCLTPAGNQALPQQATLAWLARYLKDERGTATGPAFTFVDQRGVEYRAPGWPLPAGPPVTAQGRGRLTLVAGGGSGPADVAGVDQELAAVAGGITPAPASHAVDVPVTFGAADAVVAGAPRLTLTYHGTAPAGTRPTRVFAQLVDPSTGRVLGNQVTPVAVTLDGRTHTTTVPLEMVAFTGDPHHRVELQLAATTVAYATPRLGGSVDFTGIRVVLPTVTGVTPEPGATAPSSTSPAAAGG
jgi:ABC-2 type transport system ATP-binding protein